MSANFSPASGPTDRKKLGGRGTALLLAVTVTILQAT